MAVGSCRGRVDGPAFGMESDNKASEGDSFTGGGEGVLSAPDMIRWTGGRSLGPSCFTLALVRGSVELGVGSYCLSLPFKVTRWGMMRELLASGWAAVA